MAIFCLFALYCASLICEYILWYWQAFLVTVRNKKRVGYTYELSLKFKGNFDEVSELTSLS